MPWSVCRGFDQSEVWWQQEQVLFVSAAPASILTSAMAVLSRFYGSQRCCRGLVVGLRVWTAKLDHARESVLWIANKKGCFRAWINMFTGPHYGGSGLNDGWGLMVFMRNYRAEAYLYFGAQAVVRLQMY